MDFNIKPIFYNENTLLVVTKRGILRIMRTPFVVRCIIPYGKVKINTLVYVDAVSECRIERLLFRVLGEWISYRKFILIVN